MKEVYQPLNPIKGAAGSGKATDEKILAPPPDSWDDAKLKFFNAIDHAEDIQYMAKGLSKSEVLDYYGLTIEDINALPYDEWFFRINFGKGRTSGKLDAIRGLFDSMKQKGGNTPSLSYLTRFADNFPDDKNNVDTPSVNRAFKIILD